MAELSKAIARLMAERTQKEAQTQGPEGGGTGRGDSPKLTQVLAGLRARVAPGERVLIEGMARQWLERAGGDVLASTPVEELVEALHAMFRFLVQPARQEPRVEVIASSRAAGTFIVHTWMRDRPFIVDTVQDALRGAGIVVRRLWHPIFLVERDTAGDVRAIAVPAEFGQRESVLRIEVENVANAAALERELGERLTAVVWVTDDYAAMRNKAAEIADELRTQPLPRPWSADVDEFAAFLDWLAEKNFVFLGYREYEFRGHGRERVAQVRRGSGLGLLRADSRSHYFAPQPLPESLRRRLNEPPLWLISKTNAESPVHRRGHMEYIGVKLVDATGVVVGERRFLGLFTARAYAQEPITVPLLRLKLARILALDGIEEGTHSYKEVVALFNSMSRVELLALPPEQLRETIKALLVAEGSSDVAVVIHPDPIERGVFVGVSVPKNRFSNELEHQVEELLRSRFAAAAVLERRLALDDREHVRLHLYLPAPSGPVRLPPAEELQRQLRGLLRTWDDRFRSALEERFPREVARTLAQRYLPRFDESYRAATEVDAAIADVVNLETVAASKSPQVDLLAAGVNRSYPDEAVLKLYLPGPPLILSAFLPLLENLGFQVLAQDASVVEVEGIGAVQIHSFPVRDVRGIPIPVDTVGPRLRDAVLLLYAGKLENDVLNQLILRAGLGWRQVDLLRAYAHYALQLGVAVSRESVLRTLAEAANCARALWDYFAAKFDPNRGETPREREARRLPERQAAFEAALEGVSGIEEDRLLRQLFAIVRATVRTSYFLPAAEPVEPTTIALKFAGSRLPGAGAKPLLETYVHAGHVEGVHLRAAKVARGGIRLSDRADYRNEILALMLTQEVKNAVIVPGGAKGGFVLRRAHAASVRAAEVEAAYRTFVAGLLDVIDNVSRGRVDTPARMVAYDDSDPYLVVAADKGTAGFSDVANEIARERGFWLGDAFASGGKYGYDHKRQGITARGVWECVRQHFCDLGRDADAETLAVVGIGDMSGDVFGNGLLLSRRFRLRAAFDHRHVFLDPDPDPLRSYNERERLFRLPQSSWADYNPEVLSRGGGVFARHAKRLHLPDEARAMLGLEPREYSGEELVRAVLRMPGDLLWNGGVGTYVKASDETHAEANDPANDSVRVDARELRVRVVAEGGNLGFTQKGRIEYALHGGAIDADAIDNSAGVDMSDHEVNLKICLAHAIEAGQLTFEERNRLLATIEPEVIERVLAHNRRQARVLSADQWRSRTRLHEFREVIGQLESEGWLDRRAEHLPDRDQLRARRPSFLGLTRPEVAILLAHIKRWLQRQLLASNVPDDPFFESYLRDYFPAVLTERFGLFVRSHPLRREIIAVEASNTVVDRLGTTFVPRVARDTGKEIHDVVRAIAVVGATLSWDRLWQDLEQLRGQLAAAAEREALDFLEQGMERAVRWYLETQPMDAPAADMCTALERATAELFAAVPNVLESEARREFDEVVERLARQGVPRPLGVRFGLVLRAAELFEVAELAAGLERNPLLVARSYYALAESFSLAWLRRAVSAWNPADRWERRAMREVLRDLDLAHRKLTQRVMECGQHGKTVEQCLLQEAKGQEAELESVRALVRDAQAGRELTLAQAVVLARELLRFAERAAPPEGVGA